MRGQREGGGSGDEESVSPWGLGMASAARARSALMRRAAENMLIAGRGGGELVEGGEGEAGDGVGDALERRFSSAGFPSQKRKLNEIMEIYCCFLLTVE